MPLYLIDRMQLPDGSEIRAVAVGVWPSSSLQRGSWEGLCVVGPGPALEALLDAKETGAPVETSIGRIRVTELIAAFWPDGVGHPPYRCKFVGVGAPRGELADITRRDGHKGPAADFRSFVPE